MAAFKPDPCRQSRPSFQLFYLSQWMVTMLYYSRKPIIVYISKSSELRAPCNSHQYGSVTSRALLRSEPTPPYSAQALHVLCVTFKTLSSRYAVREVFPHLGGASLSYGAFHLNIFVINRCFRMRKYSTLRGRLHTTTRSVCHWPDIVPWLSFWILIPQADLIKISDGYNRSTRLRTPH